jgi:hypothetical protein
MLDHSQGPHIPSPTFVADMAAKKETYFLPFKF